MSHINMAEISELKEIMEDSFPELIEAFVADSEIKLVALAKASQEQDSEKIAELGHSLKGASSNISAKTLSDIYKDIENAGRDRNIDGVSCLIAKAKKEFEEVRTVLRSL